MCQYACGGQRVPVEVRGYLEAISHLPSYRSWESRTESSRLGHKLHYPQSHSSWPSAFMFWNRVSRLAWSSPIWLEWQASNLQGCLCKEHQHTSSHPLLYSVKKPNTLSGPPGLSWGFGRKGIYSLQFPGGRNFIYNLTKLSEELRETDTSPEFTCLALGVTAVPPLNGNHPGSCFCPTESQCPNLWASAMLPLVIWLQRVRCHLCIEGK